MKTKCNRRNSSNPQGGFILVAVMGISLLIAILAITTMYRGRLLGLSSVRLDAKAQYGWNAQSGLEEAEAAFWNGFTGGFVSTNCGAVVDVDFMGVNGAGDDIYRVNSLAQQGDYATQVSQMFTVEYKPIDVDWSLSDVYVGFTTNGGIVFTIVNNTDVVGIGDDVKMIVVGDVAGGHNTLFDNLALLITGSSGILNPTLDGGATITTNAPVPASSVVIDAIRAMLEDYDEDIEAGGSTYNLATSGGRYRPINLNGQTIVINGGGSVDLAKDLVITGTGTVIVQGNLSMGNNVDLAISSGVTLLVGGDLTANNNVTLTGGENIVYIQGDANINNNVGFVVDGGILVGGDLELNNNADITGFVFIDGTLHAHNNMDITGVLLANNIVMHNNTDLIVNPTALPQWLADAIIQLALEAGELGGTTVTTTKGDIIGVDRSAWTTCSL